MERRVPVRRNSARHEVGMGLTTVRELIEELNELPPETKVYVGGACGYLNIVEDGHGDRVVSFDDKPSDDVCEPDWDDGSSIGCKDCPDSECTGHCMSCAYRPI